MKNTIYIVIMLSSLAIAFFYLFPGIPTIENPIDFAPNSSLFENTNYQIVLHSGNIFTGTDISEDENNTMTIIDQNGFIMAMAKSEIMQVFKIEDDTKIDITKNFLKD